MSSGIRQGVCIHGGGYSNESIASRKFAIDSSEGIGCNVIAKVLVGDAADKGVDGSDVGSEWLEGGDGIGIEAARQ